MYAPVALFAYKRPQHLQATLDALARNPMGNQTEIFVYCDGPQAEKERLPVAAVRSIARQISGFKSVHVVERENNLGLANSVISGVTDIIGIYESIIVLEDDLVTSPHFLEFMNAALVHYKNDPKAFSIGAYNFPAKTMRIPTHYPWDTYASVR